MIRGQVVSLWPLKELKRLKEKWNERYWD